MRRPYLLFLAIVVVVASSVEVGAAVDDGLLDDLDDVTYAEDVGSDYPFFFVKTDRAWYDAVRSNYDDYNYSLVTCDIDRVTVTAPEGVNGWAKVRFRSNLYPYVNLSVRIAFFTNETTPPPDDYSTFSASVHSTWTSNESAEPWYDENGYDYWTGTNFLLRTVVYDEGTPTTIGGTGFGCTITVAEIQAGHTCNEAEFWDYYPAHVVDGRELWFRTYSSVYADSYTEYFAVESVQNTTAGYYRDTYVSPALYLRWYGEARPAPYRGTVGSGEDDPVPGLDPVAIAASIAAALGIALCVTYNTILGRRGGR